MKKLKPLIIGCGKQGAGEGQEPSDKIINFAQALSVHPGFGEIFFADQKIGKAFGAAVQFKGWATTIDAVGDFDIAVVATPDETHFDILLKLAEYPLKLVICEKPLCNNLQQAREIVELYRAKGIALLVNYTRRFLPYYEDLKQRYEAGEFGKLIKASATFNRGFLHSGSHAVDLFEWLFPGPEKCRLDYVEGADYRIWQLQIFFEKFHWQEQRIGDQPVWPYYDKTHWYVVDNAYQFLEGRELIKCTGKQALKSLDICFGMMEGKQNG